MRGRRLRRDLAADCRQLGLRGFHRFAGREQAERDDHRPGARRLIEESSLERHPYVVGDREFVAFPHDANDGHVFVPELHAASDHVRIAAKPRAPDLVTNDGHRRRGRLLVRFDEHATHQRHAGGDRESGDAHLRNSDRPRITERVDQVQARVPPSADVGDRSQRLPPVQEVVEDLRLFIVHLEVHEANFDQAVAVRQRQGRVDEQAEDLEDHQANADREGHRNAANHREARILHEHSCAELKVEPIHECKSPHLAMHLLDLRDAAKVAQRRVARFLRREPASDVVSLRLGQMSGNLVVEIAIRSTQAGSSEMLKKRAMMPAERCHCASSRASCLRPVLVRE